MNVSTFLKPLIIIIAVAFSAIANAQISAPGSSGSDKTNYPVFTETDSIFVFCSQIKGSAKGTLRGSTNLTGTKTFLWEKFNQATTAFDFFFSESKIDMSSEIRDLSDGCYRITITQGANSKVYRAWVFNDWFTAEAAITESKCDYFQLTSKHETGTFQYYDLTTGATVLLNKTVKVQWKKGNTVIATISNPKILNPPTSDTEYTFRVYDQYNCEATAPVTYISVVTKASFTIDESEGEAPLTVTFTNNSENGTAGQYEWFFFRDLDEIKEESGGSNTPVDSIEVVAYDQSPVYTYEYSGTYMVKLVSKKLSPGLVCVDTFYLEDYIKVDTSFIAVPNVFTPNGDGTNDEFVVKFWSMQSIEIDIYNRWGKRIHHWESGDVRGFEETYTQTVWDGRGMGGRYASPGVYFYNVSGKGRDGVKRHKDGFFHLFRGKD
jgi:gliding motility-associated-like protein